MKDFHQGLELYTYKATAEIMATSETGVRRLVQDKILERVFVGKRSPRITGRSIHAAIARQLPPDTTPPP